MGVTVGDIGALVANAISDRQRGEAHLDEQGDMAVPQVMDPDPLDSGLLASALHLVRQVVLRHVEDAVMGTKVVSEVFQVLLHLLGEELGHGDPSHGVRSLRVGDGVDALQTLIRLRDAELRGLEDEIGWGEGEELSTADTCPVEDLESVKGKRFVHDGLREPQILLLRPEVHLSAFLRAHLRYLPARVARQVVVALGMVEDGVQLVVDGSEVGGRVRLPVGVLVVDKLVLPADDVDGLDLGHPHLPEEGDDLVLDHVLLGQPGVLPDSRPNLGGVHVDEVREEHVHGAVVNR